jgi:ERCC4-type nuclease
VILLDNRVGAKELFKHIAAPVKLQRLPFADACFMGKGPGGMPTWIGIERKTIGDLVSSIDSGRLAGHQLIGLMNSYHEVYLLIEGIWRTGPTGEIQTYRGKKWKSVQRNTTSLWTAQAVMKYLMTLSITMGVRMWITGSRKEFGVYITHLHDWWQMPYEKHTSLHQFHKTAHPRDTLIKPSFLRRACAELGGVGWKRSGFVARHFKTMANLVNATEKDLMKVEGIGKKTAQSILKELHK